MKMEYPTHGGYFVTPAENTLQICHELNTLVVSGKTKREEWKDGQPGEPVLNP